MGGIVHTDGPDRRIQVDSQRPNYVRSCLAIVLRPDEEKCNADDTIDMAIAAPSNTIDNVDMYTRQSMDPSASRAMERNAGPFISPFGAAQCTEPFVG